MSITKREAIVNTDRKMFLQTLSRTPCIRVVKCWFEISTVTKIPDEPFTRNEVSRLKEELNRMGNANFWPDPLAPPGKTTTDIEMKIKNLEGNSR